MSLRCHKLFIQFHSALRLIVVSGNYTEFYNITNIYQQISLYQSAIVTSTNQSLIPLTLNTTYSTNFTGGDAYGFYIGKYWHPSGKTNEDKEQPMVYQHGLHNNNYPFGGSQPQYFAEDMSNMVVVGVVISQTGKFYLNIGSIQFQSGFISIQKIMDGTKFNVGGYVLDVYAVMICGQLNDVIFIHVFEDGYLDTFGPFQINGAKHYYMVYNNADKYLFLQLAYITKSVCNHQNVIQNVVETFLRIALCSYTCGTCSNSTSSTCLSCSKGSFRTINGTTCPCDQGYFDNGVDSICRACTCATCIQNTNQSRTSCLQESFRTIIFTSCPCNSGYFDDGSFICVACSYTCASCNSSSSFCLGCPNQSSRTLINNSCTCGLGLFDDGSNQICQHCPQFCQQCLNSSQCQICFHSLNRIMVNNQCICAPNYVTDKLGVCQYTKIFKIRCLESNNRNITNLTTCGCIDGYYDVGLLVCQIIVAVSNVRVVSVSNLGVVPVSNVGVVPIISVPIVVCHPTCQSCNGLSSSNCLSCNNCVNRVISLNYCICKKGYKEINNQCETITEQISQIPLPLCDGLECILNQQEFCPGCSIGYYHLKEQLNNDTYTTELQRSQYCQLCDQRCIECSGPLGSQCLSCKYLTVGGQCKLCNEVQGLYDLGGKCISQCGDGIIYKPNEQCDDNNFNDNDGCSSQCLIVPILCETTLTFTNDLQPFNNTRLALITFQYNYTVNDFFEWQFIVLNHDPSQYNLTYQFEGNQIQINIIFNQSVYGQFLVVQAPGYSPLVTQYMKAPIPDYTFVSQDIQQATSNVLQSSSIFYYLILVIMVTAVLTGGFNMLFELLDLLQLLSYLKYLNVEYPYNVNAFFNYLSQFNYSFITNNIPLINNYSYTQMMSNYQQAATQPPDKIFQDGYNSLFTFNFVGILYGWTCALLMYLFAMLILKIFSRWYNIDGLDQLLGIKRSLYIFRLTLSRLIVLMFQEFQENFFFNGLLRTFISSEYALNFSLMLELNQLHLISGDFFLASSSWLALLILSLKFKLSFHIFNQIYVTKGPQLKQIKIQNSIGSALEGFNLEKSGAKYFGMIDLARIFLFMFFLVILYDNPLLQIVGVMSTSFVTSLLFYVYHPQEDRNDFRKTFTCQISLLSATFLIFLFAINKEINFLSDDSKILIGWFIIGSCLLMILVQIVIDIRVYFKQMSKQLVELFQFIKNKLRKNKDMKVQQISRQKQQFSPIEEVDFDQRRQSRQSPCMVWEM